MKGKHGIMRKKLFTALMAMALLCQLWGCTPQEDPAQDITAPAESERPTRPEVDEGVFGENDTPIL